MVTRIFCKLFDHMFRACLLTFLMLFLQEERFCELRPTPSLSTLGRDVLRAVLRSWEMLQVKRRPYSDCILLVTSSLTCEAKSES